MQRTAITTISGFEAARERWVDLYGADPQGQLFLSYAWLRSYLPGVAHPWRLVVLEEAGTFVAALPLLIRPLPHRLLPVARELAFASDPLGDYQGMLCRPGREAEAAAAFAAAIRALRWDRAAFADVHDPRFAAVLDLLRGDGIALREDEATPCFAFELPGDFETFLARLGKSTRRSTLRPMKMLAGGLPALRVTRAEHGDVDAHVDAVVGLNTTRWGGSSLREARLRGLLRNAYAAGCGRLHVVWDGARPVAGGAAFVDPVHGTYGFYLVGHDEAYEHYSAGKAVLALLVQEAIDQGYRVFDFMRGSEEYKRSYATRETSNRHYALTRPGARDALLRALQPGFDAAKAAAIRLLYRRRGG